MSPKRRQIDTDAEYWSSNVTIRPERPEIQEFVDEFQSHESEYREIKGLKAQLRDSQKAGAALARPLYVLSVGSIQTPTPKWETAAKRFLTGEIGVAEFLRQCEDTDRKLEAVRRVDDTDILPRTDRALRGNHIHKAARLLSGSVHDINTYLRGVKAWFPVSFMFHVGVIDTNVHAALSDVIMNAGAFGDMTGRYHRSMSNNARAQARGKSEKWTAGKIPPYTQDWINRRVSRYNDQSTLADWWDVTHEVLKDTPVPKHVLPQVAFNVGGRKQTGDEWETTIHRPIFETLADNTGRFEG